MKQTTVLKIIIAISILFLFIAALSVNITRVENTELKNEVKDLQQYKDAYDLGEKLCNHHSDECWKEVSIIK